MPFDPVTTIPTKRIAKRSTYAPTRGWRESLMAGAALPLPESQLVRDLRGALCLVARGWALGMFAATARNARCDPTDKDAAKFCAVGAVLRTVLGIRDFDKARTMAEGERIDAVMAALYRQADGSVMEFNDALGKAKLIGLFERTIAAAGARA